MAATRNFRAQIPIALHDQVCEAREPAGLEAAEWQAGEILVSQPKRLLLASPIEWHNFLALKSLFKW